MDVNISRLHLMVSLMVFHSIMAISLALDIDIEQELCFSHVMEEDWKTRIQAYDGICSQPLARMDRAKCMSI